MDPNIGMKNKRTLTERIENLEMWQLHHKRVDHKEKPKGPPFFDVYSMSGYKEDVYTMAGVHCPICRDHRNEKTRLSPGKDANGEETYYCHIHGLVTADVEADIRKKDKSVVHPPCNECPFKQPDQFIDCQWRPLCYAWKRYDVDNKIILKPGTFHCNVCGQRAVVIAQTKDQQHYGYQIKCTKCNWTSQWHNYAKNPMARR